MDFEKILKSSSYVLLGLNTLLLYIMANIADGSPSLLGRVSWKFSQPICSQRELEEVVEQEAAALNITDPIDPIYTETYAAGIRLTPQGHLELRVGGPAAYRTTVVHELVHHRLSHLKNLIQNPYLDALDLLLRRQPQAFIYQYYTLIKRHLLSNYTGCSSKLPP